MTEQNSLVYSCDIFPGYCQSTQVSVKTAAVWTFIRAHWLSHKLQHGYKPFEIKQYIIIQQKLLKGAEKNKINK